jgi:hypothetical protein
MRKVMFALAILTGAFMAVGPASAQCTYRMNDKGRSHGYLSGPCNGAAVGYAGAYPGHLQAISIQPRKPTPRRSTATFVGAIGFAKGNAKRLGSEAVSQILKPATRNGPSSMIGGSLASARQQIAQGWQGNPSSQAVDE